MIERIFLTVVGLMYAGLAMWCAIDPKTTSEKVGFGLNGGSGQSEFVTVYGGLEMGMALVFWMCWWNKEATTFSLLACTAIHLCLVLFRSYSYFAFSDIGRMTIQLSIGEWVVFLCSAGLLYWRRTAG